MTTRNSLIFGAVALVIAIFAGFAFLGGRPLARYYAIEFDVFADGERVTLAGVMVEVDPSVFN